MRDVSVIVMAKSPVVGRVKTRLFKGGVYSPAGACAVYEAMLACVVARVDRVARELGAGCVLAVDEASVMPERFVLPGWEVVEQGGGDLGERLDRQWQRLGGRGVVFLGVDCPDVPSSSLEQAIRVAAGEGEHPAAVGPTSDGGYWTLSAVRYLPALLRGIDWGTDKVYDQTLAAGASAGVAVGSLTGWHDVDEPGDVAALAGRLGHDAHRAGCDPSLDALAGRLFLIQHANTMSDSPSTLKPPTPTDGLPSTALAAEASAELAESLVMLVDDNDQNLELLQAYLETLPCQIITARDGLEAIERVEDPTQPKPDLILLDIMMPKMSGFEVCRRIKENPQTRTIPIMMVTALNEIGDIERSVDAGTDDFVTKPVNRLELITRVKSLLRVRHLKRELDRTEAYIKELERNRGE